MKAIISAVANHRISVMRVIAKSIPTRENVTSGSG
jgi:hypothetical protein